MLKVVLLSVCLFSVGCGLTLNTAVRRSPPGLGSPPKAWWAKEITPDFHIGGRLTERQIKYVLEAGFRSILSLFVYEDNDPGKIGDEYLPTTTEATKLAKSLGLSYKALIDKNGDWWTVETVQLFTEVLQDLPRPIYLHCNRGYTIAYTTLMYLANQTRHDPKFEPKIYSENYYRIVATMGVDFTADYIKAAVSEITGEEVVTDPPKVDAEPKNWRDWWLAHPVAKNWFAAGQLRRADVMVLEKKGYKAVVNLRLRNPSKERVTLLNVGDNANGQSIQELENNRLNPDIGSDFVDQDSALNYEKQNPGEFGDATGYAENLEREFFIERALAYFNIPLDVQDTFSSANADNILNTLKRAGEKGPVVVHCRDGQRAAYVSVLGAAMQEGYSLDWALKRLLELGFEASPTVRPDVYNMYKASLGSGSAQKERDEL